MSRNTFILVVLSALAVAGKSFGDESCTLYYIGESTVTMTSGEVHKSPYLDARTTSKASNTIGESVVSRERDGFHESNALMRINGNHFTMTESTGTVTGGGDLTGTAWNWTFLRAEFKVVNSGMRIVDLNFFADPNSIEGHKDFYISNSSGETLFMQEDVVLYPATAEEFAKKKAALLGHN